VHALRTFSGKGRAVFVKREDESGFGISGYKKRKYASLLPWLVQEGYTDVGLIGGMQSNHISNILQLLNERGIHPHLFLKERHQHVLKGNSLLTFLLADMDKVQFIPSKQWRDVEQLASDALAFIPNSFLIPEGGSCMASLAGASTLLYDILRNEERLGTIFQHIFIDSGTAWMAGALVHMNMILAQPKQIHVVMMAGDSAYFEKQLSEQAIGYMKLFGYQAPKPSHFQLYTPSTARSFGSVNRTILRFIQSFARNEGVLTDPIYTAKLFYTAKHIIESQSLEGNILIIHSGGGIGLLGFADRFSL